MPTLSAPGATLHYDLFGSGPLLLYIPGAEGRGNGFFPCAQHLSAHFTVVCMTRRGYSKSLLHGRQDFENRLNVDADDAARIIRHVSPGDVEGSATVFGSSSGAIVALALLSRHPSCIKKLIAHEPPLFSLLPAPEHRDQAFGLMTNIHTTYRTQGPSTAMTVFLNAVTHDAQESQTMAKVMDTTVGDEVRANVLFWFEFELRQYTSATTIDLDDIVANKGKFVPAAGILSGGSPGVAPVAVVAGRVGKEVLRLPGGHVGYMVEPEAFAEALKRVLVDG